MVAVHWTNTINLGAALIAALIGVVTLAGTWYAVRRKNRIEGLVDDVGRWKDTAARWETERDAAVSSAERLAGELNDLKVSCAQAETQHAQEMAAHTAEQTEIRHALKNQIDILKLKTDQTPIFEGLKAILERMNNAETSGVATVAQMLEAMEDRAVKRDAALLMTQQEIAATLNRLADRITGQVAEVVQEKVDQIKQNEETT